MKAILKSLFSFCGSVGRSTWWLCQFFYLISFIPFMIVVGNIEAITKPYHSNPFLYPIFFILGFTLAIIYWWPYWAVCARRLHDRGKSGAYCFIIFITGPIGLLWSIFELGCRPRREDKDLEVDNEQESEKWHWW